MSENIVASTGLAVTHRPDTPKVAAKVVEDAMRMAILESHANGVTDPEAVKAAILAARNKAKGKG